MKSDPITMVKSTYYEILGEEKSRLEIESIILNQRAEQSRKMTQNTSIPITENSAYNLSNLNLYNCDLRYGNFSYTSLFNTYFVNSNLLGVTLGIDCLLPNSLDNVLSIGFSQDGRYLYEGNHSGSIRISDMSTRVSQEFNHNLEFFSNIVFAFSPLKNLFAIISEGNYIQILNAQSGGQLADFTGINQLFLSIAFSFDEKLIAAGTKKGNIVLYDIRKKTQIKDVKGHKSKITCVDFSSDMLLLASGSYDSTVKIWKFPSMRNIHKLRGHNKEITALSFSGNGAYLCSGGKDNKICVWITKTGKRLRKFKLNTIMNPEKIAFSPNAAYIVVPTIEDSIEILEVLSGNIVYRFPCKSRQISSLAISPDSEYIACSIDPKHVIIWNVMSHPTPSTITEVDERPVKVVVSPNGRYRISHYKNEQIYVKDHFNAQIEENMIIGRCSLGSELFFSLDSQYLCNFKDKLCLKIWSLASGNMVKEINSDQLKESKVSYWFNNFPSIINDDNQKSALVSFMNGIVANYSSEISVIMNSEADNTILVCTIDSESHKLFEFSLIPKTMCTKILVSSDMRVISWVLPSRSLMAYKVENSMEIYLNLERKYKIVDFSISHDSRYLITKNYQGSLIVWSLFNSGIAIDYNLRKMSIESMVALSDEKHFALINSDKLLFFFRIKRQKMNAVN